MNIEFVYIPFSFFFSKLTWLYRVNMGFSWELSSMTWVRISFATLQTMKMFLSFRPIFWGSMIAIFYIVTFKSLLKNLFGKFLSIHLVFLGLQVRLFAKQSFYHDKSTTSIWPWESFLFQHDSELRFFPFYERYSFRKCSWFSSFVKMWSMSYLTKTHFQIW